MLKAKINYTVTLCFKFEKYVHVTPNKLPVIIISPCDAVTQRGS
jgi:hypothetical protein